MANNLISFSKFKIRFEDLLWFSLFLFLPIKPKWITLIFILLVLIFIVRVLFKGQKINTQFSSFKNHYQGMTYPIVGMFLFEFMHFIGMLYSDNQGFGWFDVSVKIMFMLVPLYLFFHLVSNVSWAIWGFLVGCILIILMNALWYFYPNYFHILEVDRITFSKLIHRTYFGILLNIGLIFLFFKKHIPIVVFILVFPLLAIGIMLSMSKAAVISLILVICFGLLHLIVLKKWILVAYLTLFPIFFFLLPVDQLFQSTLGRFQSVQEVQHNEVDKSSVESNAARKFTWHASLEVIKEHPFLGVGTGDVKDVLTKKQFDLGYLGIAQERLNSHNQFLNTWISIGIFGVMFLFLFTAVATLMSLIKKNGLYFTFFMLISFNALFESIFEVQAGIYAFCFGLCLVFFIQHNNNLSVK